MESVPSPKRGGCGGRARARRARIQARFGVHTRDERGLSLIELVVAISVFALLSSGLALTIDSGLNLARNNRNRSIAANLASQEMDEIRRTSFTALPLGLVDDTQTVDGVDYTVRRESEWVDNASTSGPCDSVNSSPKVLRVSVSVLWPDMRGVVPARASTILSPPVGSYDPNSGHVAVKVLGGAAEPLAAVPVTLVGPGVNRNLATTSDGCAFFAFLPAETYTVQLSSAGYVDGQGFASPSQVTGVTSGATSSVAFDYDQAAALSLTLTAPNGGSFPATVPVAVGNTALAPTGTKAFAGTGSTRVVGNLFPYQDGYGVWAGDCADADPEGQDGNGVAYWEGATRSEALQATPGGTALGNVTLPTFELRYGDIASPPGTHDVVAVHEPDNGCPSGAQYTVATFNGPGTALVALPYGTWTLEVLGSTPYAGWSTVSLDPRDTSVPIAQVDAL